MDCSTAGCPTRHHDRFDNASIREAFDLYISNPKACVVRYGPIEDWDVGGVTNMSQLFQFAESFNCDLSRWNVCNVTDMSYTFCGAALFNCDLSRWNVKNVTDMSCMFREATAFEGSGLSGWKVRNVSDMSEMFLLASAFNCDISEWDVSNVTDMSCMLQHTAINCDLSEWDVKNVTEMRGMFRGAVHFDCDLIKWDVSNVTDMSFMFQGAESFKGRGVSKWNVSSATNMRCMFEDAIAFDCDLSEWNQYADWDECDVEMMLNEATAFHGDLSGWTPPEMVSQKEFKLHLGMHAGHRSPGWMWGKCAKYARHRSVACWWYEKACSRSYRPGGVGQKRDRDDLMADFGSLMEE